MPPIAGDASDILNFGHSVGQLNTIAMIGFIDLRHLEVY